MALPLQWLIAGAPRAAGADGGPGPRALPGLAGQAPAPERVGARTPQLRCQTPGPWRLPEWDSGAAHTHLSAHLEGQPCGELHSSS